MTIDWSTETEIHKLKSIKKQQTLLWHVMSPLSANVSLKQQGFPSLVIIIVFPSSKRE